MAVCRKLVESGVSAPARAKQYFDELYDQRADPWNLASSAYEAEKYDATLRALPRPVYESAVELGCSIGVLTAKLAHRCKGLLAVDLAEAAVESAKRRCSNLSQVSFEVMSIPEVYPNGSFDLTV